MARYIDIDKYDKYYYECNVPESGCKHTSCLECFYANGGAEDVAPVIHAKWETKPEPYNLIYDCSHCGKAYIKSNYCPNCGAKMDKE